MRRLLALGIAGILLLPAAALGADRQLPPRYGLGADFGQVYDPRDDVEFVQIEAFALYDYDAVWPHRAPAPLRLKVEGNAGVTVSPETRAIVSANMLALYFLDGFRSRRFRPYAEAGIGLIYTDFQVKGQGLRINFNPQAGLGTEIDLGDGPPWFAALRLHHVSNGHLYRANRGINSVVLQVGRFF